LLAGAARSLIFAEANDQLIGAISERRSGKVSAHLRKSHRPGNGLIGRLDSKIE
jgi:hypothetical protein